MSIFRIIRDGEDFCDIEGTIENAQQAVEMMRRRDPSAEWGYRWAAHQRFKLGVQVRRKYERTEFYIDSLVREGRYSDARRAIIGGGEE